MTPLPNVYKQCLQCKQSLYTKGLPLRGGVTPSNEPILHTNKHTSRSVNEDTYQNRFISKETKGERRHDFTNQLGEIKVVHNPYFPLRASKIMAWRQPGKIY